MPPQPNIALETIQVLAQNQPLINHPAGALIFNAGDPGDCLYAIMKGSVAIDWGDGLEESLQPGDCFGFDVMVDPDRRRYCRATAATDLVLLPMDRERFLLAIQEFPMFALESLQLLDDRLRRIRADRGKA
jgi:CRP/FNR family cyclic AMP-dependent transcriptional regulator